MNKKNIIRVMAMIIVMLAASVNAQAQFGLINKAINSSKKKKEAKAGNTPQEVVAVSYKEVTMPKTYEYPEIKDIVWKLALEEVPKNSTEKHRFTPEGMHFLSSDWGIEKDQNYPYTVRNRHLKVAIMQQVDGKWLLHYFMLYNQYNEARRDFSATQFKLRDLPYSIEHVTDYKP
jgi:hypothetical protein